MFVRGVVFGIVPALFALFCVFPALIDKGAVGRPPGGFTPLFVFFYNAVWGICAGFWIHLAGSRPAKLR